MAYTTIDDGSAYFHTQLYTGNGSADRDITNDANAGDFKPDFLWIKTRSLSGNNHHLFNSSVGMPNHLSSDLNIAEATATNKATAFNTDGFRVQTHSSVNQSSATYVAWQWKANGGTTTTDTSGDIDTVVQANQTAGFSILTFTSNGSSNQTIPHGLGSAPEVFWVKPRSATGSWYCYFKEIGATHYLRLNSADAKVDNVIWGDTHPTSTLLTIDTDSVAGGTPTMAVYCFKQIKGYSKFGSYTGNGNADGAFVYTGFRPAFVLVKRTDTTGNWHLVDNKRNGFNVDNDVLLADTNDAEFDVTQYDILSNGFKLRSTANSNNASSGTYIYMAFAEHPFVSSKGVPVTAR